MKALKVGLLGIGTVGSGVHAILTRNQDEIVRRTGRGIELSMVAARDIAKARAVVGTSVQVVSDARAVIANPGIEVIIEVIGGYGIAKDLVLEAIAAGKHVVTANKALLAVYGDEIFAAAAKARNGKGVMVLFEAAVAGGIPIIKTLREGLTANRIEWVAGIINGTTNFILSQMQDKGQDFALALKEAQRLGYAEADPTFDIEGVDAAHKLTLMSALAFGIPIAFSKTYVEGISKLDAQDIQYAKQLGYRVKLLGISKRVVLGIEQRVHPTLIPVQRLMANVEGAMNAVMVHGDAVGTTLYYGKGAGSEPTASAVVADLVDISRRDENAWQAMPALAFQSPSVEILPVLTIEQVFTSFYLRMRVADKAGVLAKVTGILGEVGISIDALIQHEAKDGESHTDLIILTHDCMEATMNMALHQIESLESVTGRVVKIRKEELA